MPAEREWGWQARHRLASDLNLPKQEHGWCAVRYHAQIPSRRTSGKPIQAEPAATQRSKETSMKNKKLNSLAVVLTLVLGMTFNRSASAQTFKQVNVQGKVPIIQVAPGGASVWALASSGHPYIYKANHFASASGIFLCQISVGGGNLAQADGVFGLDCSGNIYRASLNGTTWSFSQIPGVLDVIHVGPGYRDSCHPYEVWGLNQFGQIYRYNYCSSQFDQEPGALCDIHVGGGDIWGVDCGRDAFRFNFTTGFFDQIPTQFSAIAQLAISSSGDVWAQDTSDSIVYKYNDDANAFVSFGCCVTDVQAGDGVWVLDGSNIYRWEPSALKFGQVGGSFISVSVGSGGGVWGINSSHQVFAFSTP
jgi:hypothetical protein